MPETLSELGAHLVPALQELQRLDPTTAVWTNRQGQTRSLTGNFNRRAVGDVFQDAGLLPTYDGVLLVDRSQFALDGGGEPVVPGLDDRVQIGSTQYRVAAEVEVDCCSVGLPLKKP